LGVSSFQLDNPERGFSYSQNAPLDMRMSGEGRTAKELLNTESADELTRIFREYGEEKFARKIALAIEKARVKKPLETTFELAELIRAAIPAAARREGGNPSKRVFQAVRIAVNGELDSLESILRETAKLLKPGGRFAVISFHSLEDRMVKRAFVALTTGCVCPPDFPVCVCGRTPLCKAVNRKPVTAGEEELIQNPRSKPAKLRIIEKI
jgi:16S rRNA (cytosine1402-N4)-methyltransferase